jgi:hypothetical protein
LSLAESSVLDDACATTISAALTTNTTLTFLDLHVSELGHLGLQLAGVEALTEALEANHESSLCLLDVSGDDGSPEVSVDLQQRLTRCLLRRAPEHNAEAGARRPVWQRHGDGEDGGGGDY